MRGLIASAAVCVAFGALAACSLFTSFGDLSGGDDSSPASTAPEASVPDVVNSTDGSPDASGSGPRCDDPDVILWWSFDEKSGTAAFDCGPLNINGSFSGTNAVTWGERNGGGAIEISGSGNVTVQPRTDLDPPGAMSVAVFVRSDQNPKAYAGLPFHLGSGGGQVYGWELSLDSSGRLYAALGFGPDVAAANFPPLVAGRWTHLAFVYELGVSLELYVDGKSFTKVTSPKGRGSMPSTGVAPSPSSPLHVGVRSGDSWQGAIDEVQVFRRALTATEVAQLAAR